MRENANAPGLSPPALMQVDSRRLGRYHMRLLAEGDLRALSALRARVLATLPHPDMYVPEADEGAFLRQHLGDAAHGEGETIGVFDGDRLVAYAMLGLPSPDSPGNLGAYLGQSAGAGEVAHVASCMVDHDRRGHGLQRLLLAARFSLAQARGRSLCVGMVSLHNEASRRNLMREGMRIAWVGQIEGLRRQLLAIDLAQAWRFERSQLRLVEPLDWDTQVALTREGWWGVSEIEGRGPHALVFARRSRIDDHGDGPR